MDVCGLRCFHHGGGVPSRWGPKVLPLYLCSIFLLHLMPPPLPPSSRHVCLLLLHPACWNLDQEESWWSPGPDSSRWDQDSGRGHQEDSWTPPGPDSSRSFGTSSYRTFSRCCLWLGDTLTVGKCFALTCYIEEAAAFLWHSSGPSRDKHVVPFQSQKLQINADAFCLNLKPSGKRREFFSGEM